MIPWASFACRHEKLAHGIVWTSIRYVTLRFTDQTSATSLGDRNCAATTIFEYEQKRYQLWFTDVAAQTRIYLGFWETAHLPLP